MTQPTAADHLAVVRILAQCQPLVHVERACPHLTEYQIKTIAEEHGYPRLQSLKFALAVLEKKAAHATETTTAPPAEPKMEEQVSEQPAAPQTATQPLREVPPEPESEEPTDVDVLARAQRCGHPGIESRAHKIVRQLTDLQGDLDRWETVRHVEEERLHLQTRQRELEEELAQTRQALEHLPECPDNPLGGARPSDLQRDFLAEHRITSTELRAWATAQGMSVSVRGLLPTEVLDAYEAAHPTEATA